MIRRKKKGQATIEYILLVTAVLVILIWFLGESGPFRGAINNAYQSGTEGMTTMANRLSASR